MGAFLSGIGNVCVQWALLEGTLLHIIGCIEDMPIEKAYMVFAGLDMGQRMSMALRLARHAKLPHNRFIKPLMDVQSALQGRSGLGDKRNMYVHGAHEPGLQEGEFVLTMSRWKGDRRRTIVTLLDVAEVGYQLALQAQKAEAVFRDYGVWKFGPEYEHETDKKIAVTKTLIRQIRAYNRKRAIKLFLANLKPV